MILPFLLAATALAQEPAPAPASAAAAPAAASAADEASAAPSGAPGDDYGFVAWCRGALSGHMELYASVKPEIGKVRADKAAKLLAGKPAAEVAKLKTALAEDDAREEQLDGEQLKAGQDYLDLYGKALATAEEAGQPHARGVEMTAQGYRIWSAARAADGKTRMYSYLMWDLPGRCETAAKSLQAKSSLFGAAFKRAEAPPAPDAGATAPADSVPPAASADTAPAGAAAADAAPPPAAEPASTTPPAAEASAPAAADDAPPPAQGPTVGGPRSKTPATKARRAKPAPSGA